MGEALQKPTRRRRIVRYALAGLLVFLFGPYVYSRLMYQATAVRIRHLAAADGAASPAVLQDHRIRIGAYNIAHGRGLARRNWNGGSRTERMERLGEIGRLLQAERLDVVVLNEVDFRSAWNGHVNQAEVIAREAGFPYWIEQRNFDVQVGYWSIRYGNAVLSRYPISDVRLIDYPGFATWETLLAGKKRGAVCRIQLGPDRALRVVAVHLSHRSETLRVESAKMIYDVRGESQTPLICAGDFNSTPVGFPQSSSTLGGENAMTMLLDGGDMIARPTELPEPGELTFSTDAPDQVIDWILAPEGWEFVEYRAIDSQLSDHRPVIAELIMPEGAPAARSQP